MFNRVADFHRAFGHPIGSRPHLPAQSVRDLRISLIREELEEYCHAFDTNDCVQMADGLADLLYVLAGTAVAYGFAPTVSVVSPYEGNLPMENQKINFDELLREDFDTYLRAESDNDLDAISGAVFHMMVEIFGVAMQSGIPINAVFSEVHRSNMSKLDENGKPVLRADGKVLKSSRYSPPDIEAILEMADDDA